MDIRLPGMNGFEATQRNRQRNRPTPIVVVSASVECEDLRITMNALNAGALTVLEKPMGTTSAEYEALAERLCTQLAIMSQVKVVRRRPSPMPIRPLEPCVAHQSGGYRMLGIVTSTGGPSALVQVLGMLRSDFPLPILVVQHITGSFLEGFASWLERVCPFSVVVVKDRVFPVPGAVYLATQDRHLRVKWGALHVDSGDPVCAQPSGTVLFESMASALGAGALGVLLTGMGEDGAKRTAGDPQGGGGHYNRCQNTSRPPWYTGCQPRQFAWEPSTNRCRFRRSALESSISRCPSRRLPDGTGSPNSDCRGPPKHRRFSYATCWRRKAGK